MTCKLYDNRVPVFVLFFSKKIFAGFGILTCYYQCVYYDQRPPRGAKCQWPACRTEAMILRFFGYLYPAIIVFDFETSRRAFFLAGEGEDSAVDAFLFGIVSLCCNRIDSER